MIHNIMASVDKAGYRDIDREFLVKVYPSGKYVPKKGLTWGDVFPAASPCHEICEALSGRTFWSSKNTPGAHGQSPMMTLTKGLPMCWRNASDRIRYLRMLGCSTRTFHRSRSSSTYASWFLLLLPWFSSITPRSVTQGLGFLLNSWKECSSR